MLDQVISRVIPECPGITTKIVEQAVLDAVRELCRETHLLVIRATADIAAGSNKGVLIADLDGMDFLRLIDARKITLDGITVYLDSAVSQQTAIETYVVCVPAMTNTQIPSELSIYFDAIKDGAISACLRMPYSWFDIERSAYYKRLFDNAIHDIKQEICARKATRIPNFI